VVDAERSPQFDGIADGSEYPCLPSFTQVSGPLDCASLVIQIFADADVRRSVRFDVAVSSHV
jgi:hypothetical protein